MKIRRLNHTGITMFSEWLDNVSKGGTTPTPMHLLVHADYSEELEWHVDVEECDFRNRYELGVYLVYKLSVCDQNLILNDRGLWTWLALFWFDKLCPPAPDGGRKPSKEEGYPNYILSKLYRKYHRHAIRTTWLFVKEHGETVRFVFSNPLSVRGELTEQLTSRPYFLRCRGLMQAACELYSDPHKGTWKRGAAGNRAGSVRRLGTVLNQFELTYDLYAMKKDEVLSILPAREFARFMPAPASAPAR